MSGEAIPIALNLAIAKTLLKEKKNSKKNTLWNLRLDLVKI